MNGKMMKCAVLVLALAAQPCFALTGFDPSYDAALARAKASGRQMFVLFTGSDWCHWCVKLEKEVFSQKEFLDFATNRYEMVVLDFPSKKKLPEAESKRNRELSKKFAVRGYPTVLVIDADEKVVYKTGYEAGGAKKWVESFKEGAGLDPLFAEHLAPFDKKMRGVIDRISSEFETAMGGGRDRKKMVKAEKTIAAKFLPEVEALCGELKAKEVPEELAEKKKEFAEKFEQLRSGLEKSANLDVEKALTEIEEKAKVQKKPDVQH